MKYKLEVIGSPISHTLSPLIHKTFLEAMGIEYEYRAVDIKKGGLLEYIDYVKENNVLGFNITMPHKQDIIEYLDEIDAEAGIYGSVNTVKNENGKLKGFNTDADGYKMALAEAGVSLKNLNIAVIGAGGAASAVVIKAALEGAESIAILNRDIQKARLLAEKTLAKTGFFVKTDVFNMENANKACKDADLLINATPLGMSGITENFCDLSFVDVLKSSAAVSDLIYNPPETKLIEYAKVRGLNTLNGLGMLIYQGLIADKIYFEKDFDFLSVKKEIEENYYEKIISINPKNTKEGN